ncbi:MAG: aminotransferase class IV [Methyloligellaceae bacterium]
MGGNETGGRGVGYANGRFIDIEEAAVPLVDWGFIRSDATYDVVGVWNGRFFRLEDHLDRFENSVSSLRMILPVSREEIRRILAECVDRGNLQDAYVSMTCTRGLPPQGSRDLRKFENRFYAFAIPYVHIFDTESQGRGARLVTAETRRIPETSVNPRIKNYHWLDFIMSLYETYDRNADLPLLLSQDDYVTEGGGYNIFAARDGQLVTPRRGVLEGITRQTVFDICTARNIPIEVSDMKLETLYKADEIFLTSTAGGIMAVETVDEHSPRSGCPGPLTETVRSTYWQWHEDPKWTIDVRSLLT